MSGYVGVDSALRIINQESLMATLFDPSGSAAIALNLVLLLIAFVYLGAMAGVVELSGPR